jgi:hypothetical protein
MSPKTKKILGWVFLGLLTFMALGSAIGKITATPDSEMGKEFIAMGFFDSRFFIASLEIFCAILLLIPRLSTIGVAVSAGYWGGAYAIHVAHADYFPAPVFVAMLLLGLVAIFRHPELFQRLQGKPVEA